jgi:2-polyprenyl-3-methyl-5-hydroxy-6-metoxy-1,4-benzoquinol methylase
MAAESAERFPGVRDVLRESGALRRAERLHLAGRLSSAPWEKVVARFERDGASLLDVGCGPGLLAWLLEAQGYSGAYLGVDIDERKVARARAWVGESPRRAFRATGVERVVESGFDQAAIVDVLYLVPRPARAALVSEVAARLAPGGLLVVLTSGGGPGWKRAVDRLQEKLAVVLGVTRGAVVEPCDGAEVAALLSRAGLAGVRVEAAGAGYAHGFEVVSGRRPVPAS